MGFVKGLHEIRDALGKYDFENYAGKNPTPKERIGVAVSNGVSAALEFGNTLPVISSITGPLSVVGGLGKIVYGFGRYFMSYAFASRTDPGLSDIKSGLKLAVLGGIAVVPVVGSTLNALAAAGDTFDVIHSAIPKFLPEK